VCVAGTVCSTGRRSAVVGGGVAGVAVVYTVRRSADTVVCAPLHLLSAARCTTHSTLSPLGPETNRYGESACECEREREEA
jgi:hypothetical protein